MHYYYLSLLTELIAEYKVTPKQLLKKASLSPTIEKTLLEPSARSEINLTATQLNNVFMAALELSNDDLLGLTYGARINRLPQGILGYALLASTTSGDALNVLVRYHRALLPSVNIELSKNEQSLSLRAHAHGVEFALDKFYCEVIYAGILTAGSMLLGDEQTTKQSNAALSLDYPKPDNGHELYLAIFGPQTRFEQTRRELRFDVNSLSARLSSSNPTAQAIFQRECERLLPKSDNSGVLSEKIKQLLISAKLDFPNSDNVAEQLHMSESTLRRQLKKEGVGFQQLLDEVRAKLAKEYLTNTQLPIAEVASLVGFSDSANFRRSFKRWTQLTPSEFRKVR